MRAGGRHVSEKPRGARLQAFKVWRRFVKSKNVSSVKTALTKQLFVLNPIFQKAPPPAPAPPALPDALLPPSRLG